MEDTKKLARERVLRAMQKIEQAQALLGEACAELSGCLWMAPEWTAVGKMYDRVHALWYRVKRGLDSKDERIDLDGIQKDALTRRSVQQS